MMRQALDKRRGTRIWALPKLKRCDFWFAFLSMYMCPVDPYRMVKTCLKAFASVHTDVQYWCKDLCPWQL